MEIVSASFNIIIITALTSALCNISLLTTSQTILYTISNYLNSIYPRRPFPKRNSSPYITKKDLFN